MKSILFCLLLVNNLALSEVKFLSRTFIATDITSVDVISQSGFAKIQGQKSNSVEIKIEKVKWNSSCEIYINKKSKKIQIEVRNPSRLASVECETGINLKIPESLAVKVRGGSTDVQGMNLTGKLEFNLGQGRAQLSAMKVTSFASKVGSGNVNFKGIADDLDIKIGNGDVDLILETMGKNDRVKIRSGNGDINMKVNKGGENHATKINTGNGNIHIIYQSVPQSGKLKMKSGTGNATIELPKNARVSATLKSGLGHLESEVMNDPKARFQVSMSSGMGGLKIKAK